MKTLVTLLLLIVGTTVCWSFTDQKKINGSGKVVTENRTAGTFDKIHVARSVDLFLTQGNTPSIRVEADDNLISLIQTKVEGSTLIIRLPNDIRLGTYEKMNVYVTTAMLTELEATTSADIEGQGTWNVKDIEISASTSADIELNINANKINAKASTSGDIELKGKAEVLTATASTSGDIKAKELVAQKVSATASTSGDISVYAEKEISYSASTSGDISYRGNPVIKEAHTSTSGSAYKIK